MSNTKEMDLWRLVNKAFQNSIEKFGDIFAKNVTRGLLANGVTVQKWIPVTERLPQENLEVCKNVNLLMDDGLVTVGWLNESTGKVYYIDAYHDFVKNAPISRCTHWMPLPEPPKGE